MLYALIFVVFISILAMEYREHSVCHEIKDDEFLNKKNKPECEDFKKKNLFDYNICNLNNSSKCFYAKFYKSIMNSFLEDQNASSGK